MRFAVCDDEPAMRRELTGRIHAYMKGRGHGWEVREFDSAAALLADPDWDVIFMDIRMPGLNGMEAARKLRDGGSRSRLVFTTVLRDYVFDAFAVEAADYLVKPIDPERFRQVMDRITAGRYAPGASLVIHSREETFIVPYEDIVFCEVRGRRLEVHTADNRILTCSGRMQSLEEELDGRFFRCHRSYLVNLKYISSCGPHEILLLTGERVPFSRLRDRQLKEALMNYLGQRV